MDEVFCTAAVVSQPLMSVTPPIPYHVERMMAEEETKPNNDMSLWRHWKNLRLGRR
jgi:hypothetical protein